MICCLKTYWSKRNWRKLVPLVLLVAVGCGSPENPAAKATPVAQDQPTQTTNTNAESAPLERPKLSNGNCTAYFLEYGKRTASSNVKITTRYGDIVVRLFDDTPIHRANFLMLVSEGYFSETLFHRVEKGFIAQGGKGNDLHESLRKSYGEYLLPANFDVPHFHQRGALAAARRYDENPDKRSSPFDYYLVEGSVANEAYLDSMEVRNNYTFTPHQRQVYTTIGGAPHLDGEHTVFGEIIAGLGVLDQITHAETDEGWWPKDDIYVEMELAN